MNDNDFVRNFSTELYEHYEKAKLIYSEVPEHSLVILRGIINDICIFLSNRGSDISAFNNLTLNERINELNDNRTINYNIATLMHQIRLDSNKGAHPDQYKNFTIDKYQELTIKNLKKFCLIVEKLYLKIKGEKPPQYIFENPKKDSTINLYNKAIEASEPDAQYLLGLSLKTKFVLKRNEELAEERNGKINLDFSESSKLLEKAKFFFKQSSEQNHPKATYEYGKLLLINNSEEDIKKGEKLIHCAAELGDLDAISLQGSFHLEGTLVFKQDFSLSLKYFKLAVKSDHPAALAQLGAMYGNGWGVEADEHKAFQYTKQAVEAGFPMAQYNLALYYFDKENNEEGLKWLNKSFEQEFDDAIREMAKIYLEGKILPKDIEKSYQLYKKSIQMNNVEAMFECAMACKYNLFNKENQIIKAAELIQKCYEMSNSNDPIKQKAYIESPKIVRLLKKLNARNLDINKQLDLANLKGLFDNKGFPCPNKTQRTLELCKEMIDVGHLSFDKISKKIPSMSHLSNIVKKIPLRHNKIGRNEPCPCNSGMKYKKCCANKELSN